jgi:hypothetical protein
MLVAVVNFRVGYLTIDCLRTCVVSPVNHEWNENYVWNMESQQVFSFDRLIL